MREKDKLKYQKKKIKRLRNLAKDMTPREHRSALKNWKEYCTVYQTKRLERNEKILCLEKNLEKYKKRLERLERKKKNNVQDTLKTKMLTMLNELDQRKEVVKKALFGDVLSKQLKKNYSTLKHTKEKQI
nr:unnamed protein product [Callosobruchus analis]